MEARFVPPGSKLIFAKGRANTCSVTGNTALVGVIVVPPGFDADTPIGGLKPLVRHALSLQAAGVSRIDVVGAASTGGWAHARLRVPVHAVETTPALAEGEHALLVHATCSPHRLAPGYVAQGWRRGEVEAPAWFGAVAGMLGLVDAGALAKAADGTIQTSSQPARGLPPGMFVAPASDASERGAATQRHLASLSKATGGVLDRLVMRPVTRQLTRVLCRTGVTPNMVSVFSIVLALFAAYLVSLPEPRFGVYGGALLIVVRFVDCIDGELARLKYMGSRLGAWLDTLGDGVGIFAFVLAVWVHVLATDPADLLMWRVVGIVGLVSWVIVQVLQVVASQRISGSGSVQEIAWGHLQAERTVAERLVSVVAVFARIDTISVGYAILSMAGSYRALLALHAVSAGLGVLYFSLQLLRKRVGKVSAA